MIGILTLPQKIIGGSLAALLLAMSIYAGIQHLSAAHWQKVAGQNAEKYAMEQLSHAVTRQSVTTLERALAQKNAESDARAKAFADSKAADASDVKKADAAQKADANRRGMLEGIRDGAALKPTCKVPDALAGALAGL